MKNVVKKYRSLLTLILDILIIILGYLLIYGVSIGRLVIPSLGIEGAAIAIALARLIGTIMVMVVLIKGINSIKLNRILPFKFDMKIQKNIFGIGIPAGVEQLLFNAGKFIVQKNIYIKRIYTLKETALDNIKEHCSKFSNALI